MPPCRRQWIADLRPVVVEAQADPLARRADVRPATAQRIACDLRHREQMQDGNVQAMESARGKVRDHVVVEDRREKSTAQELRKRHMPMANGLDSQMNQILQPIEKPRLGQQGDRKKKRKEKIVLGVLVSSLDAGPRNAFLQY